MTRLRQLLPLSLPILARAAPLNAGSLFASTWSAATPAGYDQSGSGSSSSSSSSSSSPVVHVVSVGGVDSAGQPLLQYSPPVTFAKKGELVAFRFLSKNHTLTQSAFDTPCTPLAGGFSSGFEPNLTNNTDFGPGFVVTVEDDSTPIWFHCEQTGHCPKGMVGAINPPSSGKTFDAFKAKALALGNSTSGGSGSSGGSSSGSGSTDPGASIISGTLSATDIAILDLLLTAENLETLLYTEGLKKFPNEADYEAAFGGKDVFKLLSQLGSHENNHRALINDVLAKFGATALLDKNIQENKDLFNFEKAGFLDSVKSWVNAITQIEGGGASGYLSTISAFENPTLKQLASEIMTIEARHNTILRTLTGESPSPNTNDAAIGPQSVLTLVGPVIDPSILNKLAFKGHTPLSITTTSPEAGTALNFKDLPSKVDGLYCAFLSQLEPKFVELNAASSSCTVPKSSQISGQTYVFLVKSQNITEDTIVQGPAIIELGAETPFAKFPPSFTSGMTDLQGDLPTIKVGQLAQSDIDIGNVLLTAETLESTYYAEGLAKYQDEAAYEKAFPGVKGLYDIVKLLGSHELDHKVLINTVLDQAGAKKVLNDVDNSGKFDFGHALDTLQSFIATIGTIESGGTSGYLAAVNAIKDKTLAQAAARIATIEARHNSFLRYIQGIAPAPVSEDAIISPNDVLTLVGGFIDPTVLKSLAFAPHTPLNSTSATSTQGSTISFSGVDTKGKTLYCAFLSQLVPQFAPLSSQHSCVVPTSTEIGGQTYVFLTTESGKLDETTIFAGPTVVEFGAETSVQSFPPL